MGRASSRRPFVRTAGAGAAFAFDGFRSRCRIPRSCAVSSASVIRRASPSASVILSEPPWIRTSRVGPSTSSMTRQSRLSSSSRPWGATGR